MLIYSYKFGSKSAKSLAESMAAKRIKHTGSKFKGRATKTVVNWGATELPAEVLKCRVFNPPEAVVEASNKRTFFNKLADADKADLAPMATTDKTKAQEWLDSGKSIVCRTVLAGHSGEGIVIVDTGEKLIDAPLYVQYKKKKEEYRVHVGGGEVFDIQRKVRKADVEIENWRVRSHDNGFIYQRNDIDPPPALEQHALDVMEQFGLDFGAVDIIWNAKEQKCYALEINTAPGLEGTTLENYAAMLKEIA